MGLGCYIVFVEEDKEAAEMVSLYKGALCQVTGTPVWLKGHGDVNGDGVINDADLGLIQKAFGSVPGDPNWNPACDLNNDGVVDINDATIAAAHVGQKVHVVGEDEKLMGNDLVVIGGWLVNPYAEHYFHKPGLVGIVNGKMVGLGVYADGRRYTRTIIRQNGTIVTAVFGITREDTFEAAKDYIGYIGLGAIDLKTLGIAGAVVTSLAVVGYAVGRAKS